MKIIAFFCSAFFYLLMSFGACAQKTLLLVKPVKAIYVLIAGDTAYYEVRHVSKPPYFSAVDTLMKEARGDFRGRTTLLKAGAVYQLVSLNESDGKRAIQLKVADEKALRKWHDHKNEDKYNSIALDVAGLKKRLGAGKDPARLNNLVAAWNHLFAQVYTLDQKDFNREFEKFNREYRNNTMQQ